MGGELSVFIDESGDIGSGSKYYLVSLVFHDQGIPIAQFISHLETALKMTPAGMLPFHFTPVLRGHAPFDSIEPSGRKAFFNAFAYFVNKLPFSYVVFPYSKKEIRDAEHLKERLEWDIRLFILSHLEFFQEYDLVKVYYDNGQRVVKNAFHGALKETIFQSSIEYRDAIPETYRLFQLADFICGVELTELRYKFHETGRSEEGFFGSGELFRKNYLKKLRRKRLQ